MLETTIVLTARLSDLTYGEQLAQKNALAHLSQFPDDAIIGVETVGPTAGTVLFIPFRSSDPPSRLEAAGTLADYATRVHQVDPIRYQQQIQNAVNLGFHNLYWIFAQEAFLAPGNGQNFFATRGPGGNPKFNWITTPSIPSTTNPLDIYPEVQGQYTDIPIVNKKAPSSTCKAVAIRQGFGASAALADLSIAAEWMGENQWFKETWLDAAIEHLIQGAALGGFALAGGAIVAGSGTLTGIAGTVSTVGKTVGDVQGAIANPLAGVGAVGKDLGALGIATPTIALPDVPGLGGSGGSFVGPLLPPGFKPIVDEAGAIGLAALGSAFVGPPAPPSAGQGSPAAFVGPLRPPPAGTATPSQNFPWWALVAAALGAGFFFL